MAKATKVKQAVAKSGLSTRAIHAGEDRQRYADDGTEILVPVKAGWNVEDWEIWAPGGWVIPLCGKKFYIQQWNNPFPDKPVAYVKVETALRPEVPIVLGVTMGITQRI